MRQGASRHALSERGNDLYETPDVAVFTLLQVEALPRRLWEPCCGPGRIVRVLRSAGHEVVASDLVDYGERACPDSTPGVDFFALDRAPDGLDTIVTNPPYKDTDRFIRHALTLVPTVIVLLRLMVMEGDKRSDIIDGHLDHVWLGRERLPAMHRDGWTGSRLSNSGAPFAWFVFKQQPEQPGAFTVRRTSWRRLEFLS